MILCSLTVPLLQIDLDLDQFPDISVVDLDAQVNRKFDTHYNLGHYVILNNQVYSKEIGERIIPAMLQGPCS